MVITIRFRGSDKSIRHFSMSQRNGGDAYYLLSVAAFTFYALCRVYMCVIVLHQQLKVICVTMWHKKSIGISIRALGSFSIRNV